MKENKNIGTFLGLVSSEKSDLFEKLQWRAENQVWLNRSATIAIKILSKLRENRAAGKCPSSQKELAELMLVTPQQINKIVKGNENLTLQTISCIEASLGMPLVEVMQNNIATNPFVSSKQPYKDLDNYVITSNTEPVEVYFVE